MRWRPPMTSLPARVSLLELPPLPYGLPSPRRGIRDQILDSPRVGAERPPGNMLDAPDHEPGPPPAPTGTNSPPRNRASFWTGHRRKQKETGAGFPRQGDGAGWCEWCRAPSLCTGGRGARSHQQDPK